MKIGDIVYHRKTGQRLSVKQTGKGDGFVLCCWMGTDSTGKPMEYSSAFNWQDLMTTKPEIPGKKIVTMEQMPSDEQRSMDELTKSMSDLAKQTETVLATAEPQQQQQQTKRKRQ